LIERLIVLDSTPLYLLTSRGGHEEGDRCRAWLGAIRYRGGSVAVPGIADYEVRRELVRRRATARIRQLNQYVADLVFLPITQEALDLAAELWARARNLGMPTASDDALDGDCIIAAQAILAAGDEPMVVATSNPGHLARFCEAEEWHAII